MEACLVIYQRYKHNKRLNKKFFGETRAATQKEVQTAIKSDETAKEKLFVFAFERLVMCYNRTRLFFDGQVLNNCYN